MPPLLRRRPLAQGLLLLLTFVILAPLASAQPTPDPTTQVALPAPERLDTLRSYIDRTWGTLTRSHDDLLAALPDEKVDHAPGMP